MANAGSSIFNKKATEKLRSPDDLDKFVRVTNPSVWVVLAACGALLIGLLSWGVFGTVASSVTATGAVVDGTAMCFVSAENVVGVQEGDAANVGGVNMKVSSVARVPMSVDESKSVLGNDFLVSALVKADWVYCVKFDGDVSELEGGVPLNVNITTERMAPITLILKNWG